MNLKDNLFALSLQVQIIKTTFAKVKLNYYQIMKQLTYLAVLTVALFSFAACDKDDSQPDTRPVYSYFRGYVNDEKIVYEQRGWESQIVITSKTSLNLKILSYAWYMGLHIDKDTLSIYSKLSPLEIGQYILTPVKDYNDFYSEVVAYWRTPEGKKEYIISEEKPIVVLIENVDRSKADPEVTGYMSGVLFNKDNPNDSLKLKDIAFRVAHP